ncbi:MAG TPA: hypothetical protein VHD86_07260 [Xanthobacteraceae bacterium]|nr:hypothetical protein [Xanthobacteraceae bacterium]
MSRSSTTTAERLNDGFFLQLQSDHDLMARRRQIGEKLKGIRPRAKAA